MRDRKNFLPDKPVVHPKKFYIGYTKNLQARLKRHNSGKNISTKSTGNWVAVHTETFADKHDAWKRERQIKKYKDGNAFKKLILKERWPSG